MAILAAAVPFLFILFLFFDGPAFVMETISEWINGLMDEKEESIEVDEDAWPNN